MSITFAWSLCLSVLVVLLSTIPLTIGRIKAGYSIRNMSSPRALFNDLPEFGKRSVWGHQNCWESISLHAPACILCLVTMTDSNFSIIAAWIHPFSRLIYIGAYVLNIPVARGIFWAIGVSSTMVLYKEALVQLI